MKDNKLIGKIVDFMLNVLIVLLSMFLLVSLYTAVQVKFLKNEYANFFGYSLFEVQTGSMHGTIEIGDWIIVKTTKDVERNDIITYKHGKDFVTHRVVEKYKGSYVTKGDANNTKDDPIDQEQVVGKVVTRLSGFGILRKVFFNPYVIISLIVCLYLFQLTFKTGKSEFDQFIEKIMQNIKNKFMKEKTPKKKEEKNVETLEEGMASILDDDKEIKYETENSSEIAKKIVSPQEENKDDEEQFANTSMFRMIDIESNEGQDVPLKEEENVPSVEEEEEASKTSFFRIIEVDDDIETEDYQEEPVIVEVLDEEKPKKKQKIQLNAEKVPRKIKKSNITKNYMNDKIKKKKAKNILDKVFIVKRIMVDEILNILLSNEKSYILKSSMRKDFVEQYFNIKYFGTENDRIHFKEMMNSFSEDLRKKYIRDQRKTDTIDSYLKAILLIHRMETKNGSISYQKELSSFVKDDKNIEKMETDITNVITYSLEIFNEILEKFESNSFKDQYKKIDGVKNLYGVSLNHNIAFSKVYSSYIVDKTYTEGIVSEDKIQVLLNLLLCKITNDIMKHDYDSKYIVFIPSALYEKDKKLDKIVSTIDNDYAKNHIFFLTTITNMKDREEYIQKLSKKGYHFALSFNKSIKLTNKVMGYIYLADYYFKSLDDDNETICKSLPKEIKDLLIQDSLDKKIGDYRGD